MGDKAVQLRNAFERVYRDSEWGHGSGPGSSPANTIEYRAFVSRFIEANGIRSVTDLGCGDWQFSHLMDWSGVEYLGFDVVPEIVERNRSRFSQPNLRFEVFASVEALPGGDLLLAKEVLQHLPNSSINEYLDAIRQKYRFALLTNSTEPWNLANREIEPGGFRPIRLEKPPFSAPGAIVFTYFPQAPTYIFKNAVFLMLGGESKP
jgi:SAM-dependent methyltransferase